MRKDTHIRICTLTHTHTHTHTRRHTHTQAHTGTQTHTLVVLLGQGVVVRDLLLTDADVRGASRLAAAPCSVGL